MILLEESKEKVGQAINAEGEQDLKVVKVG
jgi:hypothetical protein